METSKFSDREKHRLLEAIDFIGTQEMSERQRALLDKKVERALRAYREKPLREAEVSASGTVLQEPQEPVACRKVDF